MDRHWGSGNEFGSVSSRGSDTMAEARIGKWLTGRAINAGGQGVVYEVQEAIEPDETTLFHRIEQAVGEIAGQIHRMEKSRDGASKLMGVVKALILQSAQP